MFLVSKNWNVLPSNVYSSLLYHTKIWSFVVLELSLPLSCLQPLVLYKQVIHIPS